MIIGNFKQLALLAGAAFIVDKLKFTEQPMLLAGCCVVALSSLMYSYQTNVEKAAANAAKKAAIATEKTPLREPLAGSKA